MFVRFIAIILGSIGAENLGFAIWCLQDLATLSWATWVLVSITGLVVGLAHAKALKVFSEKNETVKPKVSEVCDEFLDVLLLGAFIGLALGAAHNRVHGPVHASAAITPTGASSGPGGHESIQGSPIRGHVQQEHSGQKN